jgi:hypothetical protein
MLARYFETVLPRLPFGGFIAAAADPESRQH